MTQSGEDIRRLALSAFEEALDGRRDTNIEDSAIITPKPLPSVRRRQYLETRAQNALKLNDVLRQRLASVVEKLSTIEEQRATSGAACPSVFEEHPQTKLDAAVLEHVVLGPSAAKRIPEEDPDEVRAREQAQQQQKQDQVDQTKFNTIATQTTATTIQKIKNAAATRSAIVDPKTGKAITVDGRGRMYPIVTEAEMLIKSTIPLKMLELSVDARGNVPPGISPCKVKFDEEKGLVFKYYDINTNNGSRAPSVIHEWAIPFNHVVQVALGQSKKTFQSFIATVRSLPLERLKGLDTEVSYAFDYSTPEKVYQAQNQSLTITFNTSQSLEKSEDSSSKAFYNMIHNPPLPQFTAPTELGQISLIVPATESYDIFTTVLDLKLRAVSPRFLVPFDFKAALAMMNESNRQAPGNQLATLLAMLSEDELEFCSMEHITPQIYLGVKKQLLSPDLCSGIADLKDLRQYVDVDLLRLKRILWFLEDKRLIRLHRVFKVDDSAVLAASGSGN